TLDRSSAASDVYKRQVYYSTDFAEIVYSKILILYTFDFLTQALFEETVWQMVVVRRMLLHKY
ncbi:hypothetical protein, partial [uncultured Phascolarctobacterium sp.]|uniref:hypothetical protein n=1 Tax=uncultured Phascolarctobacterium sp. TaxID=512296 RepID=UPI0026160BE4